MQASLSKYYLGLMVLLIILLFSGFLNKDKESAEIKSSAVIRLNEEKSFLQVVSDKPRITVVFSKLEKALASIIYDKSIYGDVAFGYLRKDPYGYTVLENNLNDFHHHLKTHLFRVVSTELEL